MQVLVFSKHPRASAIKEVSTVAGTAAAVTLVRDEDDCRRALARCMDGETILVFFIGDPHEMGFLETQARAFIDMKLIICLDTPDDELAVRALRLKPRLVIDSRDNPALLPGAVGGILSGMLTYKKRLRH